MTNNDRESEENILEEIDNIFTEGKQNTDINNIIELCNKNNLNNIGILLYNCFLKKPVEKVVNEVVESISNVPMYNTGGDDNTCIRIMMYGNWTDSKSLCDSWNKMSKDNNYRWNNIKIVWEEPADYYCIVNCPPPGINIPSSIPANRIIVLQMEPYMNRYPEKWGEEWSNPSLDKYKFVSNHVDNYNNNEWHISKTWKQLHTEKIHKNDKVADVLSTVLSDKYSDPGHIKRIDFTKFLEQKGLKVDVYGGNKFNWKRYKGSLPYQAKDDALFPYKYTFNVENHSIKGYYTEKLIDGILSECLTVYSGCPNIKDYLDPEAYVYIDLLDFEKDYNTIKQMIEEDWHTKRLPAIRRMKTKILNETQFFPRMEKIINE